jgi:DeoR/GlpR family transcriptional regulator of sugar metabolism
MVEHSLKCKNSVKSFTLLNQKNIDKRQVIAKKAVEFIEPGETIILDSGSKTTEIAKKMIGRKGITVINNALNIAMILGAEPGIEVILTGSEFKPPTLSLTGQKAASFFEDINVDRLFPATAGISLRSGLTYPGINDISLKKAMIDAANITYIVADSTKIGKNAFASLGNLSLIDYIITDSGIDQKREQILRKNEIEIISAV